MNEQLLIQQLREGNAKAFDTLVNTYQNRVFHTALGIVQQLQEAEDVAQEVFVQVYQSINDFKGEAQLSTWIYRITISKALDWQRKKKRKKRFAFLQSLVGINDGEESLDGVEFVHPGLQLVNKEKGAMILKAVNALADNQKIAFLLHYTDGLSQKEVANIMNVTEASVEAYLHRAKQNLRKLLEKYYTY